MSARSARALKLVKLGERALEAARARATSARRVLEIARASALAAEQEWLAEAERRREALTTSADLEERQAHLRTLRLVADASQRRVAEAADEESRCLRAVVEAAGELRKLQLWQERIDTGEREEEARHERRGADEIAARRGRETA